MFLHTSMDESSSKRHIQIVKATKKDIGKIILVKRTGYSFEKIRQARGIPCTETDANWYDTCLVRYDGKEAKFAMEDYRYYLHPFKVYSVPDSLFSLPITDENV